MRANNHHILVSSGSSQMLLNKVTNCLSRGQKLGAVCRQHSTRHLRYQGWTVIWGFTFTSLPYVLQALGANAELMLIAFIPFN